MEIQVPGVTLSIVRPHVQKAFAGIHQRFEVPGNPKHVLSYHAVPHSAGVLVRATAIARVLGVSELGIAAVQLGAALHDFEQDFSIVMRHGLYVRERWRCWNERWSALQFAFACMGVIPGPLAREAFNGIQGTIPDWCVTLSTVVQPCLDITSDIALSICLADLGSPGMDPATYALEPFQLFVEDNPGLYMLLENHGSLEAIPLKYHDLYRDRLLVFLKAQVPYIRGRQRDTEFTYSRIGPARAECIRPLMSRFEESLEVAFENYQRAETRNFVQIVHELLPAHALAPFV